MTSSIQYTRWPGLVAIYCLADIPLEHREAVTELLRRWGLPYFYQHVEVELPDTIPSQPGPGMRSLGLEPNTPKGQIRLFLHNRRMSPVQGWSDEMGRITLTARDATDTNLPPANLQGLLLHELGHTFEVVSPYRERVNPDRALQDMANADSLLAYWGQHCPEGRILHHGWHCLNPACIMQTGICPERWRNITALGPSAEPFCSLCRSRWYDALKRFSASTL